MKERGKDFKYALRTCHSAKQMHLLEPYRTDLLPSTARGTIRDEAVVAMWKKHCEELHSPKNRNFCSSANQNQSNHGHFKG